VKSCPTEALKATMPEGTKDGAGFLSFDQSSSCLSTKKEDTINTGIVLLSGSNTLNFDQPLLN